MDDFDGRNVRGLASGGRKSLLMVSGCSGLVGALIASLVMYAALPQGDLLKNKEFRQGWSALSADRGLGLTFEATRAAETLGELSDEEIRAVAAWVTTKTGAWPYLNESASCKWLAGPSAIELFRPPKSATVAYLDGHGPKPTRYARVTLGGPSGVDEYRVGPLESGKVSAAARMERVTKPGDVSYVKRPTENNEDASALLKQTIEEIGAELLVKAFGHVFPQLPGYTGKDGTAQSMIRADPLEPAGLRVNYVVYVWQPPVPKQIDALWLHPMPLRMKQNVTSPNRAEWNLMEVAFCGQVFPTAAVLRKTFEDGKLHMCPFHKSNNTWDVPQHETPPSTVVNHELNSGVRWGPWTFTVTQRPSTGIALLDIRFHGERILYELSLQDAQAAYAGDRQTQFFYSDASWSLSMLSASLEPGVDCPEGAHYLPAATWFKVSPTGDASSDPTQTRKFYPMCVFEWEEDHTIWRHMVNSQPPKVHGLVRKTVVVRTIATVANYDYIIDVKLREDGEIETYARFAGYIESRYYDADTNPHEKNFSTILKPHLAGPVHSHIVSWKADIDVAGVRANSLARTQVKVRAMEDFAGPRESLGSPLLSKYLDRSYVAKEGSGVSTFISDTQHPGYWALVDRNAVSDAGNPRGYAVTLSTYATGQVLPPSHPFVRSMSYTKYNLAVTRYHDEEYRVTSPYISYDTFEMTRDPQDLDHFLSNEEDILDQDLVAWITAGREHVTRQEDLPLVSNFGVGFSLQPWNFFTQNVAANPPWKREV